MIIVNIKDENGRLIGDMTMTGGVEGRGFLCFLEAWAITLFQPSHQISPQIYQQRTTSLLLYPKVQIILLPNYLEIIIFANVHMRYVLSLLL